MKIWKFCSSHSRNKQRKLWMKRRIFLYVLWLIWNGRDPNVSSSSFFQSNVQSTQEIVELILDSNRNALLGLDLKVSIGTLGIGTGALVAGLFGMNVGTGVYVYDLLLSKRIFMFFSPSGSSGSFPMSAGVDAVNAVHDNLTPTAFEDQSQKTSLYPHSTFFSLILSSQYLSLIIDYSFHF